MRRAMVKVGADAQRIAAQRGILRGLLGHGGTGPVAGDWKSPGKGLIRVKSPKIMSDGTVISGLTAIGLAAMQELGGRTRPHAIKVHAGKKALNLKGFIQPYAVSVKHPGGIVHAHPFMKQAIDMNMGLIVRELELAMAEEMGKLGSLSQFMGTAA